MHVINNALWIMSSILLLIDLLQSSHINQLFILTFFEVFINFAVFINIVSPDHLCTVGPRSPSPIMGLTDSYEKFTRRHQTPGKRLLEKEIPGTPSSGVRPVENCERRCWPNANVPVVIFY